MNAKLISTEPSNHEIKSSFILTHVLVSADSVRALGRATGTIFFRAVVTSFLAVVLSNPIGFTPVLVASAFVGVLTGWLRFSVVIITSSIVGCRVTTPVVRGTSCIQSKVAAVLPEVTVVVVSGELHESFVSPLFPPGILN